MLDRNAMRVFVALDLEDEIRKNIARFVDEVRAFAPRVRWIGPEALHVTLKFIGDKPDSFVAEIEQALRSIRATPSGLRFRGVGFFPTPQAARVFWVGIEADSALGQLASSIEDVLAKIGIAKEQRAFSRHLTLARASGARVGSSSGAPGWRKSDRVNRQFAMLQEKLSEHPAPDFGTMSAREFFLYRSQLSSKGSRYTKIARFELQSFVEIAPDI